MPRSRIIPVMGEVGGLGVPIVLMITWLGLLTMPPGG